MPEIELQYALYECEKCGAILRLRHDKNGKTLPCPVCKNKKLLWVDAKELVGTKSR